MNESLQVGEVGGRPVVSSGRPWESIVGYSRAVRAGAWIAVTGTVGCRADGTYPGDAAEQMRLAIQTVLAAIEALGGQRTDVVRTRMFVTDISQWEAIGRAHGEVFGDIRPATTMVEVSRLIDAEALVEIEAEAVVRE